MRTQKATCQVQRGGKGSRAEPAHAPVGRHEVKARLRLKQMSNADAAEKMGQVRAAAHADVLARIDQLARGAVGERTGPAAQAIARLDQSDLEATRSKRGRGRQASQARTDDDDTIGHMCPGRLTTEAQR